MALIWISAQIYIETKLNLYDAALAFTTHDLYRLLTTFSSSYSENTTTLSVFQERTGTNQFTHEALTLKYKLDNEFELIYVVSCSLLYLISQSEKKYIPEG